jgi:hypothetical protein
MFSPTHIGLLEPQNGQPVEFRPLEKCTWYRF